MVRAMIFVSAILAMVVLVSAAPHGSLVGADIGYVGAGDINAQNIGNKAVNVPNASLENVLANAKIL